MFANAARQRLAALQVESAAGQQAGDRERTDFVCPATIAFSYDDIGQLAFHVDGLPERLALDELLHVRIRERGGHGDLLRGVGGNAHACAHLAIHLHGDLDRVLHEGIRIRRPPAFERERGFVAELGATTRA